jgi:hypothetical protein
MPAENGGASLVTSILGKDESKIFFNIMYYGV